ncbi:hypothetical protein Tco_0367061 [Tanacetum coccineum]
MRDHRSGYCGSCCAAEVLASPILCLVHLWNATGELPQKVPSNAWYVSLLASINCAIHDIIHVENLPKSVIDLPTSLRKLPADRNLDGKRGWRKGHLRKGSQAGSFLAETGLVSVEHQMQEIGLAPRSGYQQKDRKPSQNDKTEHGMEKTVQNQGQSPKMPKSESILKNTIGCNLNPSDGPGKPNSIFMKTVKTKWALNQFQQPICVQLTKTVKTLKAQS